MSAHPYELPSDPPTCARCDTSWEEGYRAALAAMRGGLAVRVANDALWTSPYAGVLDALKAVSAALSDELEQSR